MLSFVYQRLGAVFPQRSESSAPIFTPPQTQPLSSYPPSIRSPNYQQEAPETSAASEFPTLRCDFLHLPFKCNLLLCFGGYYCATSVGILSSLLFSLLITTQNLPDLRTDGWNEVWMATFSELHACLSMDYHRVAMKFGQNDVTLSMQLNILEFHYSNGFIL